MVKEVDPRLSQGLMVLNQELLRECVNANLDNWKNGIALYIREILSPIAVPLMAVEDDREEHVIFREVIASVELFLQATHNARKAAKEQRKAERGTAANQNESKGE